MRFFGLKSCDTCRKARKALETAGYAPDVVDVRADGLSDEDIEAIVAAFGDQAINRASTTWRGLSDEQKEQDAASLLRAHPTLMKRPVIVTDAGMTIGWKADVQQRYLGS
ncbi:arsenate reductase family protein [Yoonia litorea]|uniref:Transcriptional regulator, Spx/MgsR family n=1 Tax=Yoonia litorea TaxID=1123755 RepID=A0A1I6MHG0_9RHOB|nr:ArsC/Spx/MgsR family protein [Yoonia litorea]SFS15082.1 transcriptional regulator, Spx/MgsR family [Yoonia litorea]